MWRKHLVRGLGFRTEDLQARVSGFGFRVSGFGFRVSGFGFMVYGLGFRVQGLGYWGIEVRRLFLSLRLTARGIEGQYIQGGSMSRAASFGEFGV